MLGALAWTSDSLDEDNELEQFAAGIPGLFVSKAVEQPADMQAWERYPKTRDRLIATSQSTTKSQSWRDRVCLRALYFIPNAIQAALSNVIRGPGSLVTIPPFLNSYESCVVANALSQDPGIDMKTRLDAECVAATTCARLDPSDQRTPPILVDRLDMPGDEVVQYIQTRERDNLCLRTFSALFDAYAALAWVCVIS
jgi:hypothetical protein